MKKNKLLSFIEDLSFFLIGRITDITIVISEEHAKIYRKYTNKKTKIIISPILMDLSCPSASTKTNIIKKIIYAGAISKSNGIEILIKSSIILKKRNIPHNILIFGPVNPNYREYFK
ncbi:hypothetical protein [Providencia rustigianii]|uniref:hypothetical protein n=1 Tax=Providencia rustigianii TaxID=158850 RepID=UPI000DDB1264